ncbi:MAG TPA: hypothetical protein VHO72_12505 [Bacteroidales bacterium]|nr:hypothetical protein [Bacteroidales bacterium]
MKQFLSLFLLLLLTHSAKGQFYESGQDPASIKWMQIRTPNFQIIYPSTFDSAANRLANSLEYLYSHVAKTLNHKPKKISVVLHTQSVISNGFVTWAPKRMELYTTPPQDSYGQEWMDQLAIHELRHVVQIDKLNQGLTRIAGILFGEQAMGAVSGLVPRWFFEGDAVYTESVLTNSGRGRMGSFTMEMKSLILGEHKPYSFEKMVLGSYKDYIPNHYNLGYTLVAFNRATYSDSLFARNLTFTARNPYYPFAFSRSFVKQTGLNDIHLYNQAFNYLKTAYASDTAADNNMSWAPVIKKHYTNYSNPIWLNDTTIFAVKSGIDQIRQFILLYKSGKEKVIHTPGNAENARITLAANKLVWAEGIPHVRWSNAGYSNIKMMDLTSGKVRMISHRTRYFSPALSPDLQQMVCVNTTADGRISLVFLKPKTGEILMEESSPDNVNLQDPIWSRDGKSIIVVLISKSGKALYQYTMEQDSWKELIPWSYQNLSMPHISGNRIFYSSDVGGTNHIYALNTETGENFPVAESEFGAFDPIFDENTSTLLFSEYSSQGFALKYKDIRSWQPTESNIQTDPLHAILDEGKKQEGFNFQDSVVPVQSFTQKKYSKLLNIINIHSWAPFYYNYDQLSITDQTVSPGFTILSQDKLGTCLSSFGIAFENNNLVYKTHVTYKGLFPVIDFSMDYGSPELYSVSLSNGSRVTTSNYRLITNTQIYLPLNLTRGKYLTSLLPFVNWEYDNYKYFNRATHTFIDALNTISTGVTFYKYLRLSTRDLAPKWGVMLTSRYFFKPLNQDLFGERGYIRTKLFLPGLLKHHSFQVAGGYFEQKAGGYVFKSSLAFPRGYQTGAPLTLNTLSTDYSFPILYPDLHVGRFLYVKRIRSNLFADYGKARYQIKSGKINSNLVSTGIDLTTDSHFFRVFFPVNIGIRTIYFPKERDFASYLLFSINFNY